jgi:hypothetical protein
MIYVHLRGLSGETRATLNAYGLNREEPKFQFCTFRNWYSREKGGPFQLI